MTPETAILRALHDAGGGYTPAGEVASRLEAGGTDILRRVDDLRRLGFDIESHPHHGLRLVSVPDRILADDLQARLSTRCVGSAIRVFEETDSTNDLVRRFAREGHPAGLVVFADSQRRGRGRHGRAWASPPRCGLYFSVLLRPPFPASRVPCLTLGAAAAVAEAARDLAGLPARIKWPNDVHVRGRKAAGILTETVSERERVVYVVVGIGINVNTPPESFPEAIRDEATSFAAERGGRAVDRPEFAASVLQRLDDLATAEAGWGRLLPRFEALCETVGATVAVRNGTRLVEGEAVGIDGDGSLRVRTAEGRIETIRGGEVREVRYGAA